jgi:hypothetical protein
MRKLTFFLFGILAPVRRARSFLSGFIFWGDRQPTLIEWSDSLSSDDLIFWGNEQLFWGDDALIWFNQNNLRWADQ